MEVIPFVHTHWDREWYRSFQEFRLRLIEVIDLLINQLQKNNINCFYLDGQTIVLEDYLEIYPEKEGLIKDFIKNKRIFVGPWYILADEFLVSGESLTRNLLIGINQSKKYGCDSFFGYLPDSFGHNSQIPKILSSFDIKNAVLWRGAGEQKSEFIWKSDDGSAVLTTYLTEGYFQDILHGNISIEQKAEKLEELLNRIKKYSMTDKILLPMGGDHLGPVLGLKDQINELNAKLPDYTIKQAQINEYLSDLEKIKPKLDVVKGELRNNGRNPILSGCFSSRLYLKQLNAAATWKLSRIAEPLQAFLQAAELVRNRKNELDYTWRLLLKNHPHDSICGCSVDEVHEENISRFKQINQISEGVIDRCINTISSQGNSLFVCNMSNYSYTGVVKIKTDKKMPEFLPHQYIGSSFEFPKDIMLDTQRAPFSEDMREFSEYLVYVEDILPFSMKTIPPCEAPEPVEISKNTIKNSLVEIAVNPDGSMDFRDLKTNKIFKNLHIITDRADIGDTYNYAPLPGDKPLKAQFIKTEIVEKGSLRSILRVFYELDIPKNFDRETNSRSNEVCKTIISTDIMITAGSKRVEFITNWENLSQDHTIKIKFNLTQKIHETISEDTFGLIKRDFDPDYRIETHIPAQKGHELKTNTAPMQRFVFAQGLGIITEGLSEYGVSENSLFITILRATGKLSDLSLNTRNFPAGPPLETPGAQCTGKHSVKYAICSTESAKELFKEADEFMGNTMTQFGSINKTFINVNNPDILIYGVKIPENREIDGVAIRFLNISDELQRVNVSSDIDFSRFNEINSLEEQISQINNIKKEIIFKPNELKTFLFFILE